MNTCGDCSLCCKIMAVPELDRVGDVLTWCKHCTKPGCGIYEQRPNSCREFRCLWLQQDMGEELKPKRCHVVLASTTDAGGVVAHVDPEYPDAYKKGAISRLLERLGQSLEVYVVIGGEPRKTIGPHAAARVRQVMKRAAITQGLQDE